jgi:Ni,Fe-hydrogenase III large subunit
MTLERIGNIEVPARGQHIRMIMAELERLHSHLLWAGVAAELIGFETLFMQIFRLRESVMDTLESISGNRVNYSMNRIGGVNRDLLDDAKVRQVARDIRSVTEGSLIPLLTTDQSVIARCKGVGVLSREDAIAYGVVGPVARASGLDTDLRRDQPYLAYDQVGFAVPVQTSGDVLARVVVRALEIVESCKIIDQVLDRMPQGSIHAGEIYHVPAGNAALRIEAPRGEVFYYIASNGSDIPDRVKVRTPSFANIPSVAAMVKGNTIADVPLIQAALDPCYSCTDR